MNPLWDLVERSAESFGDKPGMHTEDRTYSFSEIRTISANVAAELRSQGLSRGDVIATLVPNGLDWLIALAAAHEGLISVSLHHIGQADDVGAALVIVTSERRGNQAATVPVLEVDEKWTRARERGDDSTPAREFDSGESIVRLVLTSGTTGRAKAAEYSVDTIMTLSAGAVQAMGHGGQSRLSFMGFSSMGGIYQALAHMTTGTPYIAIGAITSRLPGLVDELDITVLIGATVSLAQVCDVFDAEPSGGIGIERVIVAGSTPSDALLGRLTATFPNAELSIMYGSTEGGLIAVKVATSGTDPRIVGHVVPHVTLEICDEAGQPVTPGEVGEVRYRSPELITRYFRNPEATAQSIREGWFYPGDRAKLTTSGELMIVGRLDDVLNLGGVKIDPLTLESIALAVPGVTDAAAYLAEGSDGRPVIELALVASSESVMREVDGRIRDVPGVIVPSIYRRVSSLPHNQMGKLVRDGIAEFAAGASF